jgi:hypothetical protein
VRHGQASLHESHEHGIMLQLVNVFCQASPFGCCVPQFHVAKRNVTLSHDCRAACWHWLGHWLPVAWQSPL